MLQTLSRPLMPAAVPTKPPLSQDDRRALVVAAYRNRGSEVFKTFTQVEYMTEAQLRALPVAGTALQVAEDALKAGGAKTNGRVGGIMDAVGFDQKQMDHAICHCVNGLHMTGHRAAENFASYT